MPVCIGPPLGVALRRGPETGTELFDGWLGSLHGTFTTTFEYTAKMAGPWTTSAEIHGRCHHPVTGGTGDFAGASGEVSFRDVVYVNPPYLPVLGQRPRFGTAADLHHMGGAYGRVPEEATAFPTRAAEYWLNLYGFWDDAADDPARIAWVKAASDTLRPYAIVGEYVNFLGHDEADPRHKALAVYGESKLARLTQIKRRYDPENVFRINHNIPPGG